jgi:hypothetical protein
LEVDPIQAETGRPKLEAILRQAQLGSSGDPLPAVSLFRINTWPRPFVLPPPQRRRRIGWKSPSL